MGGGCCGRGGAGADGGKGGTGVVVGETVFKAVLAVTGLATYGDGGVAVDVCFAGGMRALCSCRQSWFLGARGGGCLFPPCGCPFSGVGAFMGGLCAVVEAVGSSTRLAAEGKEVQLVAKCVLTVSADSFHVFVHSCKGLRVWWRGCGGGSHDGLKEVSVCRREGSVSSSAQFVVMEMKCVSVQEDARTWAGKAERLI